MIEIIGILLVSVLAILLVAGFVRGVCSIVSEKCKQKEEIRKMETEEIKEPTPTSVGASVIDKQIKKRYLGRGRGFEYQFMVAFLTDADDDIEYQVSEEMFAHLKIGQTGTLVTVNRNFYDFGDGEDI